MRARAAKRVTIAALYARRSGAQAFSVELGPSVSFGLKAHSGWAALVVLGRRGGELEVVERRRVELVDGSAYWAKQPYHAAEGLPANEARIAVKRGIDSARRIAVREMRAAVKSVHERGLEVRECAVLVGEPMPDWSVEQILAVHFRMHKAEGALFRDVLVRAAAECGLKVLEIPENALVEHAVNALRTPISELQTRIAALGKSVGPPWGKDQKDAALAAMLALPPLRR